MDGTSKCVECERELRGEVRFGLCPACLLASFLTTSGVFAPENRTPQVEQLRRQFCVGEGRFRLIESLGEGGMGQVWLAEDLRLDRMRVALKFVSRSWGRDTRLINELRQELIRTRDLQDKNIVKVHDWHAHDGEPPFISMEYVEGLSLGAILAHHERGLSYRRLHPLLLNVCQALVHAHEQGIIHRDIKPANVLTYKSGTEECAKLTDFGIGQLVEHGDSAKVHMGGTVPYMSPSQAQHGVSSAADDIFSLGATMYQLLTGELPFGYQGCLANALTPFADAFGNEHRRRSVPAPVRTMIWSCLQLDPASRPETMARVLAVLRLHPPPEDSSPSPVRKFWILGGADEDADPGFNLRPLALLLLLTICAGLAYRQRDMIRDHFFPAQETVVARPPKPAVVMNAEASSVSFTFTNANPSVALSSLSRETNLTQTAQDGRVHFDSLLPGSYSFRVEQIGYDPKNVLLQLHSGRTNITLGLVRHRGSVSFRVPPRAYQDYRPTYKFWRVSEPPPDSGIVMTNSTMVISNVPTDEYMLSIIWPGGSATTKRVVVEKGRQSAQGFSFGLVRVEVPQVYTDDGRVMPAQMRWETADGFFMTNTPATFLVPEGERLISFEVEGFHRTNVSFVLFTNKTRSPTNLVVTLTRSLHPLRGDRFTNRLGMAFCPLVEPSGALSTCWIDATEVTRDQFQKFVDKTGADMKSMKCLTATGLFMFPERSFLEPGFVVPTPEAHPVVGVSWLDAVRFCRWLTTEEQEAKRLLPNQSYTLPTGAQWQLACNKSPSSGRGNFASSELMRDKNWPTDWHALVADRRADGYERTAPVGKSGDELPSLVRDPFDVRNLQDNVQEWCLDEYDPGLNLERVREIYDSTLGTNRITLQKTWRVVCGGSWYDHDPLLWQSTTRLCAQEDERTDFRGFRVVIVEKADQ